MFCLFAFFICYTVAVTYIAAQNSQETISASLFADPSDFETDSIKVKSSTASFSSTSQPAAFLTFRLDKNKNENTIKRTNYYPSIAKTVTKPAISNAKSTVVTKAKVVLSRKDVRLPKRHLASELDVKAPSSQPTAISVPTQLLANRNEEIVETSSYIYETSLQSSTDQVKTSNYQGEQSIASNSFTLDVGDLSSPPDPTRKPSSMPSETPSAIPTGQPSSYPTMLTASKNTAKLGNATKDMSSAIKSRSVSAVEQVINELGPENMVSSNTALSYAVMSIFYGTDDVSMTILRKTRLSLLSTSQNGNTLLHWACYIGNNNMVRNLLKSGADFSMINNAGETPVMIAYKKGYRNVVDSLHESGATS